MLSDFQNSTNEQLIILTENDEFNELTNTIRELSVDGKDFHEMLSTSFGERLLRMTIKNEDIINKLKEFFSFVSALYSTNDDDKYLKKRSDLISQSAEYRKSAEQTRRGQLVLSVLQNTCSTDEKFCFPELFEDYDEDEDEEIDDWKRFKFPQEKIKKDLKIKLHKQESLTFADIKYLVNIIFEEMLTIKL
jgi:hypothetical protein